MFPPCFPPTGPSLDAPLPSTGSARAAFPRFTGTTRTLRLLPSFPPSFSLRTAVPLVASPGSLPSAGNAGPMGLDCFGFGHSKTDCDGGEGQASQVPWEPSCTHAPFSDPGRIDTLRPLQRVDAAPASWDSVGSCDNKAFEAQWRGSACSLSTLRAVRHRTPRKTHFRLLARLCRVGLGTHRVPALSR